MGAQKELISSLSLVFSGARYKLLFAALLIALTLLYFTLTNVFLFGTLTLNPSLKIPDAFLIFCISALSSLGFTIFAYRFFAIGSLSATKASAGGSLLGIFASACPVFQPICFLWLGLGSVSLFLVDYSFYIALASVLLLLYANYASLRSLRGCPLPKRKPAK